MYSIILAGLMAAAPPVASPPVFNAILEPDPIASEAYSPSTGGAMISIDGSRVRYNIKLAGVDHVTAIALIDQGVVVPIYSGPTTGEQDAMLLRGVVPRRALHGVRPSSLASDMRNGQVDVVVFTTESPGGAYVGKLYAGLAPVPPAHEPMVAIGY